MPTHCLNYLTVRFTEQLTKYLSAYLGMSYRQRHPVYSSVKPHAHFLCVFFREVFPYIMKKQSF